MKGKEMLKGNIFYIYNRKVKDEIIGAVHEIRRDKIYRAVRFDPNGKGTEVEGDFCSFSNAYDWVNKVGE